MRWFCFFFVIASAWSISLSGAFAFSVVPDPVVLEYWDAPSQAAAEEMRVQDLYQVPFRPATLADLNPGFSQEPHWYRLRLANPSDRSEAFLSAALCAVFTAGLTKRMFRLLLCERVKG